MLTIYSVCVCGQLQKLVLQNVLAFNEGFWIRLAARTDTCKSEDDKAWFQFLLNFLNIITRHYFFCLNSH